MQIALGLAEQIACDLLEGSGTCTKAARSVAHHLVRAEAEGQTGHGLRRIPPYLEQLAVGKVQGDVLPDWRAIAASWISIDARHGFAFPALDLAVDLLRERAKAQIIAGAGITRSHHAGVAGHFVEALAECGLVAMMFSNSPAAMAFHGAHLPVFGTNPIAFAIPRAGAEPLVIDLSLSQVARGKIMAARQRREPIPDGWALDCHGRPTNDPDAAIAGSMMPVGGMKGSVLALMVELLSSVLTGAHFSKDASSFLDSKGGPPGTGQLLLAID
ncbi:MAG: Ldh family oxidoreductase, partial [Pseudomonadota bacterium]